MAKDAVEVAERTLSELQERARLLAASRGELERERKATAYAAHALGNSEANQRLGAIADMLVRHDADMAALADAIAEAERRLESGSARRGRHRRQGQGKVWHERNGAEPAGRQSFARGRHYRTGWRCWVHSPVPPGTYPLA